MPIDLHLNFVIGHSLEHNGLEIHDATNHYELVVESVDLASRLDGGHCE